MDLAVSSLTIVLILFSFYILAHLVIFRSFLPKQRWVVLKRMYLFFIPLVVAAAISVFQFIDSNIAPTVDGRILCSLVLLWLFLNGYLMFYAFIDRSLSIRTNFEFEKIQNQPMTLKEIMDRYDTKASYLRRLEILKASGYLKNDQSGPGFHLTSKGVFMASSVRWLKKLYRLGPGG
ncbi:MAG: hypothetical protein IPK68_19700 [Bdellovibrionales bacterium]|nr:hypothetical protein [Bdellovibrionales bacterium]